jgi:hypothetical protein
MFEICCEGESKIVLNLFTNIKINCDVYGYFGSEKEYLGFPSKKALIKILYTAIFDIKYEKENHLYPIIRANNHYGDHVREWLKDSSFVGEEKLRSLTSSLFQEAGFNVIRNRDRVADFFCAVAHMTELCMDLSNQNIYFYKSASFIIDCIRRNEAISFNKAIDAFIINFMRSNEFLFMV